MLQNYGLMYRAALEGTTFSLFAGMNRIKELGLTAEELIVVGGGAKNDLWCQIIADCFGLPVRQPAETESAALGAALQAAAVHQGASVAEYITEHGPRMKPSVAEPDPSKSGAYAEAFARHRQLGELLFGQ